MTFDTLALTLEAPLARLTLNHPSEGNRIDTRTLEELRAAVAMAADSDGINLLVVTAAGDDFCRGWEASAQDVLLAEAAEADPFGCLAALPFPAMAVLHGRVAGAGLALALACDVRVARRDATFSASDAAQGHATLAGIGARLPRIAGRGTATSMLLLGTELDAEAAYRAGLVSRVLDGDGFEADVSSLASRITANGPLSLRYVKELLRDGMEMPLDQALRYELDLSVILQTTHDRAEGVQAFLEKRPPGFKNR